MTRVRKTLAHSWRFWVIRLDQRESATGWALFRIAIAICVLASLGSLTATGLLDVLWVSEPYGGYRHLGSVHLMTIELGPATPALINTLYVVAVLSTLAVLLGIGGGLLTFCTLQSYLALTSINADTVGSYDSMITIALWLLLLCDGSRTLSFRCWRDTGRFTRNVKIVAWPRYVVIFQLLIIYTATGLQKVSADWFPAGDFRALYYVLQEPTWRRFDLAWTAHFYPLTQIATAITWFFESFAWLMFVVYYFRYTKERGGKIRAALNRWDLRKPFAAIGVSLHLGVFLLINVGPFSLVTIAYYLCLWRPEELERLAQRATSDRATRRDAHDADWVPSRPTQGR